MPGLNRVKFQPSPGSSLSPRSGFLAPAKLGELLVIAGMWQVLFFITWNGWPFSRLKNFPGRLFAGNAAVIASAVLTYLCR